MRKLVLLAVMLALVLVLAIPTVAQAGGNTGSFTNQQGMYNNRSTVDHGGNRGVHFKIGDARNESGDITTNNGHGKKKKKGKRR